MSKTTAARDHRAKPKELTESIAHVLIETGYAASIHNAHVDAANTRAEFRPFVNDRAIEAAAQSTTGTKSCK
jgi:hypothetical protein